MIPVGQRVYHTKVRANGIITEYDSRKRRDKYKVEFFWAKYCKDIPHGTTWNKWMWCEEKYLVETPMYYRTQHYNKVTSIGGRSLDRLIRKVCEIPRRKYNDDSDVVIVYGQSNHNIPEFDLHHSHRIFTINQNLIPDKFQQMKILGEDLAPKSVHELEFMEDYDNWIIKPNISMGGRGIRPATADDTPSYGEYYQRRFEKVREFRVHCFLWMNEPVQMIQEKHIDNKDQLTWNKKQGGKFHFAYQADMPDFDNLRYSEPIAMNTREMLEKASIIALKKLKYDFGGLDFGMDKFGNLKIFEVNSRMGLLEQTLYTYKRIFTALRTLDINQYKQERWR